MCKLKQHCTHHTTRPTPAISLNQHHVSIAKAHEPSVMGYTIDTSIFATKIAETESMLGFELGCHSIYSMDCTYAFLRPWKVCKCGSDIRGRYLTWWLGRYWCTYVAFNVKYELHILVQTLNSASMNLILTHRSTCTYHSFYTAFDTCVTSDRCRSSYLYHWDTDKIIPFFQCSIYWY